MQSRKRLSQGCQKASNMFDARKMEVNKIKVLLQILTSRWVYFMLGLLCFLFIKDWIFRLEPHIMR